VRVLERSPRSLAASNESVVAAAGSVRADRLDRLPRRPERAARPVAGRAGRDAGTRPRSRRRAPEFDLAASNLKRTEDLASKQLHQLERAGPGRLRRCRSAEAKAEGRRGAAGEDAPRSRRSNGVGRHPATSASATTSRTAPELVNIEDIDAEGRLPPARALLTQLEGGPAGRSGGRRAAGRALPRQHRRDQPAGGGEAPLARSAGKLDNTDGSCAGHVRRVRVLLGDRPNALMVPEEAVVPLGDEFFVYTVAEGKASGSA